MSYDNHATFLSDEWWANATADDVNAELARGADINAEDELGRLPVMYAVVHNSRPEVIKALIAAGADVNAACDEDGMTVLMYAAMFNLPEMIDVLVDNGADINALDYSEASVVDYAQESTEALEKLHALLGTPDTNFFNEEWWPTATPEDIATEIAEGADINAEDEWTHFPLIYAAVFGSPEALNAVAAAGADINAACRADGMTALMYAAWQNTNPQMCKFLLNWGANINAQDNEGNTAFDYAQENSNPDVAALLQEYVQTME